MSLSNFPPDDANPLLERLDGEHAAMAARTKELLEAVDRVPAKLEEATHDKAAAFVKQIRAHAKQVDAVRETEKKPYLEAGRTIDGWARVQTDPLAAAAKDVEGRIAVYLREKAAAERIERERAEREAREEAERRAATIANDADLAGAIAAEQNAVVAAKAAAAPVAELARTHTSFGVTSTLRSELAVVVVDRAAALVALAPYLDDEAVQKAGRAWLKANHSLAESVVAGRATVAGLSVETITKARVA